MLNVDWLSCVIKTQRTRVAAFSRLNMPEGVPAPRKRTQPTKPRAPKKTKVVSQTKVEEAPSIINEDTVVWEKELDDLFRKLREPQDENVSTFTRTQKDPYCPLRTHVSLKKKVSKRGWEYVRCSEKNCPMWLPWDLHLNYVLSDFQNKMQPALRQGFFYCFCREPCKVGLTIRIESPNRGRCFLTCAQKNAQREGGQFFQWIDEVWGPRNTDLQMCMSKGQ